jgi:hypothetical protein
VVADQRLDDVEAAQDNQEAGEEVADSPRVGRMVELGG